jgi:hypothetical protein
MKFLTFISLVICVALAPTCYGQDSVAQHARRGSYFFYERPVIEDNSFLIEEAFNQEMGVLQHIFSVSLSNINSKLISYSFTQEIPLTNGLHQFSYTLNYSSAPGLNGISMSGFGDLYLSFRQKIFNEYQWAIVIPKFTLLIPTGKAIDELGTGGLGGAVSIAVTKRISKKIVTHYNAGYTLLVKSDLFKEVNGARVLAYERNLRSKSFGASVVWYPLDKLNFILEAIHNTEEEISGDGSITVAHENIINPGFRFCIDNGRMQIVPGFSMPIALSNKGTSSQTGLFFYLSFEPDYLPFFRSRLKK